MSTATQTKSIIVERTMPHSPGKIWRALTQAPMIAEWLMKNDFKPVIGHRFDLSANWGVVACRVTEVEPNQKLAYTWEALGLESVVTWTLTPSNNGTLLRMEQIGFRPDQEQAYQGAKFGWPRFLASMEQLLARLD